MRVFGNDITVQRGESFTIDFTLRNKDDSPYVVNKDIVNPYILITVSSNNFNTANNYVLNQWCSLSGYFLFQSLNPVPLVDPSSAPSDVGDDGATSINGSEIEYYNKNIFTVVEDGETHYKYYSVTTSNYEEYDFRIIVSFGTDITKEWSSQRYNCSISLVSGVGLVNMDQSEDDFEDKIDMRIPILVNADINVLNSIGG